MSTRQQRREWQEFREQHGATLKIFKIKWRAMFNREPTDTEIQSYLDKKRELTKPLGAKDKTPRASRANITVQRTISMGHRLPSYDGICSSMHGHNVTFEVMLHTTRFTDFKLVDRDLAHLLEPLDHAMVLYQHDSFVPQLRRWPQRLVLLNVEPTTEALAELLFNELSGLAWHVVEVKVYETSKYAASVGEGGFVKRITELPTL